MKSHSSLRILLLLCSSYGIWAVKVTRKKQKLTEIPFADIPTHVTILDLSINKLTSLGPNIFADHVNIEELNFYYNEIVNVSSLAFSGITNLKKLGLRRNKLTAVPDLQLISSNLIELNLRQNEISSMDIPLNLQALEILTLAMNKLASLSVGSLVLLRLKSLDLKYNRLSSIDNAAFGTLPSLVELFLTKNLLTVFNPTDLNISESIEKLILERNRLNSLPANSFNGIQNLKKLDLNTNKLTGFDIDLLTNGQGFPVLEILYLDGNKLTTMPSMSPFPTGLQDFNIGRNSITDLDHNYFLNFTQLKVLNLHEISLLEMPKFGNTMPDLQILDLSGNHIPDIPENYFTKTPSLQILNMNGNKLRNFSLVFDLSDIKEINLDNNMLSTFPDLGSSVNLVQILHVSNNDILQLTLESIYGTENPGLVASSLTSLFLDGNHRIGPVANRVWSTMPNLEILSMGDVSMTTFQDYTVFSSLTKIYLQENSLTSLGETAGLIMNKQLSVLNLENNQFASIKNLLEIADNLASSSLKVFLQGNSLTCDASMCWMKYMNLQ